MGPSDTPRPNPVRWPALAALAGVLAVALALRIREARLVPLGFDGIYTVLLARHPLPELVRLVAADIEAPLSFVLRRAWTVLGGSGEGWHVALAIGYALAAIALAFDLGRRLFGVAAGLLAAAMLAVHRECIAYSTLPSDFGLAWLAALLPLHAAWRWNERRSAGRAAWFAVTAALAWYAHYMDAAVAIAAAAWGAWCARGDRPALRRWALACAGALVLVAPDLPVFADQFRREGSGARFHFASLVQLRDLARRIAFGGVWLAAAFVPLALVPFARARTRPAAILIALACAFTLVAIRGWVVVLPRDVYFLIAPVLLLVAAGVTMLPGRVAPALLACGLLALGARSLARSSEDREPEALARTLAAVRAQARPGDLIVHAETHSLLFFLYHWPEARQRLLLDAGRRVPYYDGGLAVPDSTLVPRADWDAIRATGARWWGIRVDRALATKGHVYRAGLAGERWLSTAPGHELRDIPPVAIWAPSAADTARR